MKEVTAAVRQALARAIEEAGSAKGLASKSGVKQACISRYKHGGNSDMANKTWLKLEPFLLPHMGDVPETSREAGYATPEDIDRAISQIEGILRGLFASLAPSTQAEIDRLERRKKIATLRLEASRMLNKAVYLESKESNVKEGDAK